MAKKKTQSCAAHTKAGKPCQNRSTTKYCSNHAHKTKMGRPTLYRPEYCEELLEHFDVEANREVEHTNEKTGHKYTQIVPNNLPTLAGFARKIKVGTVTLRDWARAHPDFLSAVTRAKAIAEDMLVTNALTGIYNPQFSVFVAKNYTDLRDVQEHKDVSDEKPMRTPADRYKRIAELNEDIKNLEAEL